MCLITIIFIPFGLILKILHFVIGKTWSRFYIIQIEVDDKNEKQLGENEINGV